MSVLTDCLNSVASQSHNNIEHVVIDGASTDGTLSLLNSKKDQLSILVSESDDGIYDAMNKGIKIAKGDIIGFLNSDDFYANNEVISKVVSEFKKEPSLDACYADLIYVNQNNINKVIRYFDSGQFKPSLFASQIPSFI